MVFFINGAKNHSAWRSSWNDAPDALLYKKPQTGFIDIGGHSPYLGLLIYALANSKSKRNGLTETT
jgi:hypothetical protein